MLPSARWPIQDQTRIDIGERCEGQVLHFNRFRPIAVDSNVRGIARIPGIL